MDTDKKSYGYYHLTLRPFDQQKLLRTNDERAFVISQLQDMLSLRLLISESPPHQQFASCIDLLAFSVTATSAQFILFAIDISVVHSLTASLLSRLAQYRREYGTTSTEAIEYRPIIQINKLRGPHQALAHSFAIHALHHDWEYDRYSSIGFYLHDRRGDWMRIWRITSLYENDPEVYRMLLERELIGFDNERPFIKAPILAS